MKLRCPDCRGTFSYTPGAWPRFCPLCGTDINNDRDDDDIVMPFVRRGAMKATDQVYRDMERGSEVRAQLAAEKLGVPVSEMSDLKITNLNSSAREGDVAAVDKVTPVTQMMDTGIGGFQGANGAAFAAGVKSGHYPNAGAGAVTAVQRIMGKT